MTRTVEEQIEAACQQYFKAPPDFREPLRQAMRDLLDGKFAEEPLPEIAIPKWGGAWTVVLKHGLFESFYIQGENDHVRIETQRFATEREAVESWNAGMRGCN